MGEDINALARSMSRVLQAVGVVVILAGIVFCFFPRWVKKFNEWGQRLLFTDEGLLKHPVKTGVLFIILGLIILSINIFFAPR